MPLLNSYNPALLKLELLSLGLRVSDEAREAMRGKQKEATMIRAGVGGSGLDLVLEKEVWVNAPTEEAFAADSPLVLSVSGSDFFITRNQEPIQKVSLVPPPAYYDKYTSSGIPMKRIGRIQGDFLAVSIDSDCFFWGGRGGDAASHCRYCVMGKLKNKTEEVAKPIEDVIEVYREALKEKSCRHLSLCAGAFPPPGRGHEEHAAYVRAIKENFDGLASWVRICPAPPEHESYIDLLREAGADHVGYCYEIYDPVHYSRLCPGKFTTIDKGIAHQTYDRMLKYAVGIMGRGAVHSNVIAGLEPKESTAAAFEHFGSMGVIPRAVVFRPLKGGSLRRLRPPDPATLVYIYRKFKEVVEGKYGLDVLCPGCARIEIGTKFFLGVGQPLMPEITDADLKKAGFNDIEVEVANGAK